MYISTYVKISWLNLLNIRNDIRVGKRCFAELIKHGLIRVGTRFFASRGMIYSVLIL